MKERVKQEGAQWLSGRVLELRQRGPGFEPHRRHRVARHINPSLVLVKPRKTCPYITERLLMRHKFNKRKYCQNLPVGRSQTPTLLDQPAAHTKRNT